MTMHEVILTIVDTAVVTSLAIGVIYGLTMCADAIMNWIRVEFFEPEEKLEVVDEEA